MEDVAEDRGKKGYAPVGLEIRFWGKVLKKDNDSCWNWAGAINHQGYGVMGFRLRNRPKTTWLAHRVAYLIINGEIPTDLFCLHKCDNPACVNPSHLFLGTNTDNMHDASVKGRIARGERTAVSKLKTEQVKEIRKMWELGQHTAKQLAVKFSISFGYIYNIVHRRSWKHIA